MTYDQDVEDAGAAICRCVTPELTYALMAQDERDKYREAALASFEFSDMDDDGHAVTAEFREALSAFISDAEGWLMETDE